MLLSGLWPGLDSTLKHLGHSPAGIARDGVPTLVLIDVDALHV